MRSAELEIGFPWSSPTNRSAERESTKPQKSHKSDRTNGLNGRHIILREQEAARTIVSARESRAFEPSDTLFDKSARSPRANAQEWMALRAGEHAECTNAVLRRWHGSQNIGGVPVCIASAAVGTFFLFDRYRSAQKRYDSCSIIHVADWVRGAKNREDKVRSICVLRRVESHLAPTIDGFMRYEGVNGSVDARMINPLWGRKKFIAAHINSAAAQRRHIYNSFSIFFFFFVHLWTFSCETHESLVELHKLCR